MRMTSDHCVLGAYASGSMVASVVIRPRWEGPRLDLLCVLLDVRRESGPDFVRRLGIDLETPSCALGAAMRVHGVFDVSDPAGGEHLRRALIRDRRLARLARGRLRADVIVAGERDRSDGVPAVPRAQLLVPLLEAVTQQRLVIEAASALLRELAAQLKSATAKPPKLEDGAAGEDLVRALAAAVFLPDALAERSSGGVVALRAS